MDKERLTFWEILFEGIKKFAGEIIGAFLLAVFLLYFPGFSEYVLPEEDESQTEVQRKLEDQRQEQERLKEELRRKEAALKEAEARMLKSKPAFYFLTARMSAIKIMTAIQT